MCGRERFQKALSCQTVDRPPIWIMRQAGRVLPEYCALRQCYDFVPLVQTPELCAEVTLQPVRRFGFDAAILFSDILVIPEALGQKYAFIPSGGIKMDFALQPSAFEKTLQWNNPLERLAYTWEALGLIHRKLGDSAALLGFAGSPWTLAGFMCEGSGGLLNSPTPPRALAWYQTDPKGFHAFMERLTDVVADYLIRQFEYGVLAAQIFDSLAQKVPAKDYWNISGQYIDKIVRKLGPQRPIIVYCKGEVWRQYVSTSVRALSVDWHQSLSEVKQAVGEMRCVQGNLNPALMTTDPQTVRAAAEALLQEMRRQNGFIVNLGHGIPPTGKLECISALVQAVQQAS